MAKAGQMDDEERLQLIKKMDKEVEDFIQERSAAYKKQKEEEPEEEEDMDAMIEELRQHPAFITEFDPTKEMSPLMEGLQQLKYESEIPEDNAESFKEDGNHNFKLKKYKWAIDNYTKGLEEKAANKELNAILYSNRAAAQFRIGNMRSSFNDCLFARKFKVDHMKAIVKGIECSIHLKQYDVALKWCSDGLLLSPKDEQFLEFHSKADKLKRQQERDKRKDQAKERKKQIEEEKLIKAIKDRGIKLGSTKMNQSILAGLESHHPSGAQINVDEAGVLHWPVLLVYPEHGQTDFIEAFDENTRFADHLDLMFGHQVEPAPWDKQCKYKPHVLEIYFEDRDKEMLYRIDKGSTLGDALKHEKYEVFGGTPSFILIVKGSDFAKHFLSKYKL